MENTADDVTPIRILLAGLSEDQSFAPILSAGLDDAIRNDVAYLGAYATALIELNGTFAVEQLLTRYIASDRLSPDTREKLLSALAVQHKAGDRDTRRSIVRGVAALVRQRPELSDPVARQFGIRSNWAAAAPILPEDEEGGVFARDRTTDTK